MIYGGGDDDDDEVDHRLVFDILCRSFTDEQVIELMAPVIFLLEHYYY